MTAELFRTGMPLQSHTVGDLSCEECKTMGRGYLPVIHKGCGGVIHFDGDYHEYNIDIASCDKCGKEWYDHMDAIKESDKGDRS